MDKVNCNSMIDMINKLKFNEGFELFKVEENFTLHKKRTYLIRDLNMVIEKEICCFSDFDDLILDNFYILSGFLTTDVVDVLFLDMYTSKIIFNEGYIIVQALCNL